MIPGVDLSHLNTVPANVVDLGFVFHKATQGTDFVDPTYAQRAMALRGQVPVWGAYHFWGSAAYANAQAYDFLHVASPQAGDVLILDFESDGGPEWDNAPQMAAGASLWMRVVRFAYPANRRLLYCNEDTLFNVVQRYGVDAVDGLWIAHPGTPPPVPYLFWQYDSIVVDHDYANFNTVADLVAWARGGEMELSDSIGPDTSGAPVTVQKLMDMQWATLADSKAAPGGKTLYDELYAIQAQIAQLAAAVSSLTTLVGSLATGSDTSAILTQINMVDSDVKALQPSKLSGTASVIVSLAPATAAARNDRPADPTAP